MSNSSKDRFPILGANRDAKQSVPWSFIAPHSERAEKNHGQTLERLAERGGLSALEMLAVVLDLSWNDSEDIGIVFIDRSMQPIEIANFHINCIGDDLSTSLLELLVDCYIGEPEGRKVRVLIVLKAAAQYLTAKKEGV